MARETSIEKRHARNVKRAGGESYKFVSPGRRHVPDRLDVYGAAFMVDRLLHLIGERLDLGSNLSAKAARFECERLLEEAIRFTETKATGKKPRPGQTREHARLRKRGFRVDVVDSMRPVDPTDFRVDIINV